MPIGLQVAMTFKNQQVLVNCSWEVKKGERVGLVGEGGEPRWRGGPLTFGLCLPPIMLPLSESPPSSPLGLPPPPLT